MPTVPAPVVSESGLGDATGFLDVDKNTLRHVKYDNIFGLGDILNVPTTKSWWGGFNQLSILRHNLERKLKGLSQNVQYDGYSKSPFMLNSGELAWLEHKYDSKDFSFNTSALNTTLNSIVYSKTGSKEMISLLQFKSWGPPYHKFKKTFDAPAEPAPVAPAALAPEKKVA